MTSQTSSELLYCVANAANLVHKQFRRHVEYDDLTQELWLWVYGHEDQAHELLTQGTDVLVRHLRGVGDRWARQEKAARGGYSPADEVFYSLQQLRGILPDALDPNAVPPGLGLETERVSSGSVDYSDYEAGLADVRAGLALLASEDRHLLDLHYRIGFDPDGLGVYYGVPTDNVYRMLGRALRRLRRHLGGSDPWPRGDDETV